MKSKLRMFSKHSMSPKLQLHVGFLMAQLKKEHKKDILLSLNHWMTSKAPKTEHIRLRDQMINSDIASDMFIKRCFEHNQYSIFSTSI